VGTLKASLLCGGHFFSAMGTIEAEHVCLASFFGVYDIQTEAEIRNGKIILNGFLFFGSTLFCSKMHLP
jgi:hypothetical protein